MRESPGGGIPTSLVRARVRASAAELRMVLLARCAAEQYPALFTHVFDGTKQLGKLMAKLGRNNIATMG